MLSRTLNALARKRTALDEKEKGFTLIELLVVVIIIGILAAIAIPVYLGVQNNAKDSAVQSDVTSAKTAVISYETDKGALPPDMSATTLGDYGFTLSKDTDGIKFEPATDGKTFCIAALSSTGSNFYATDQSGVTKAATAPTTCTAATAGEGVPTTAP